MGQIFDFGKIEKNEEAIKKTWVEFRAALAKGEISFDDVSKAKNYTFLKVYDDLFHQHSGIDHKTITIKDLDGLLVGRGTILGEKEVPDYERFIPKSEFIKKDNRFSPPGVEWLYLALGNETDIHECSQAECRAKKGSRFGFCHFSFKDRFLDLKLVNLAIADNISYAELNSRLDEYGQKQLKKGKKVTKALGFIPKYNINVDEFCCNCAGCMDLFSRSLLIETEFFWYLWINALWNNGLMIVFSISILQYVKLLRKQR